MEPWLQTNSVPPPQWSTSVGWLGNALTLIGAFLFAVSAAAWIGARWKEALKPLGAWSFTAGCLAVFGALGCVTALFVWPRFEFDYVWSHCDLQTPLVYRLAGIWAGQQGSFLLWACCAAFFGLVSMRQSGEYRRWFSIVYGAFLSCLCLILAFWSPFAPTMMDKQAVNPVDGFGMSPALLNFWMTIHPPVTFLGFGALTVLFAYAFAAMATGNLSSWVPLVRPWAIVATTLVGLGLCMGGFWAYETLGWGGFWMWDPVENVSFVPWMLGAAFLHGLPVQAAKGKWVRTNLVLGGLPFLAFVYGTYLTRSGLLSNSVHGFVETQKAALGILAGVAVAAALSFAALWLWRAVSFRENSAVEGKLLAGLNREGVIRWGIYFLVALGLAALAGMTYPAVLSWRGMPGTSLDEGPYHQFFVWIFVPLMLTMAVAPFIGWSPMSGKSFVERIYNIFCLSFGLVGLTMFLIMRTSLGDNLGLKLRMQTLLGPEWAGFGWVLFFAGLCIFVFVGALWRTIEVRGSAKAGTWAFLSHAGVATLLAGMIVSRCFELKDFALVPEGGAGEALGLRFDFKGNTSTQSDRDNQVLFEVSGDGKPFVARLGLFFQPEGGEMKPVVRPYIHRLPLHDVYIAVQPPESDASDPITLKPGQTVEFKGYKLTYDRLLQPSAPGVAENEFGVRLKVQTHMRSFEAIPKAKMAPGGFSPVPAPLGSQYEVSLMGIDPQNEAVTLKIEYAKPVYRVDVLMKPLTVLVWAGTALLTLAGLGAAWLRRKG